MKTHAVANTEAGITPGLLHRWLSEEGGSAARTLHAGRNVLVAVPSADGEVVIKRFSNSLKNRVLKIFSKSKARKSFINARKLQKAGVDTPEPLGYIERRNMLGIPSGAIYFCRFDERPPLRDAMERYGEKCLQAFARFVASLHTQGILHRDLNNTNVIVNVADDGEFAFALIDLNRIKFYPDGVPAKQAYENLTRFSSFDDGFRFFVKEYARERAMNEADIQSIYAAKSAHDRKVDRKKAFKRIFKKQK